MEYIRIFNNDSEYQQFKDGDNYITPNICLDREINSIKCKPYTPPPPPVQMSNEIWYTSSDGNIVTPYYEDVFGANIISNTYENGQGIITFDGPVTSIGGSAFGKCTSLTSVNIPDSVTSIENVAFAECSSLTSVTIPDSVTSFGMSTFLYCTSLTSVTIPNNVTSIYATTFQYCSSLTSVTIPNNITVIGVQAFAYCTSLTSIYCTPMVPPRGSYEMFANIATGCKIYVPTASVDAYKSAYMWSNYADYIVGYDFEDDGGSELITFSIESPNPEFPLLERQAESGMTWEEWVYSDYNLMYEDIYQHFETFSYASYVNHYEESWQICYDGNNTYVGKEDTIIPNYRYTYSR